MNKINCELHGFSEPAFVCQHIARGLLHRQRVGFCWSGEDVSLHPDAWCSECEERRKNVGGLWVGVAEKHLQAQVLCVDCYQVAKVFHTGGNPWS